MLTRSAAFCCIALACIGARQAYGSTLLIIASSDGPARRLDYNRQGLATGSDVWTYTDSASATGIGFNHVGSYVFQHSQAGRAAFGNLGASRTSSITGAYLNNPVSGGYVAVSFGDTVSFAAPSGTPEYLEVDISVNGSLSAQNYTTVSAYSDIRFGNAQHYYRALCIPTDLDGGLNCNAEVGLNPANTNSLVMLPTGFSSRQTWRIPLSMMFIGPVSNSFSLSGNLTANTDMWQSGNLPPASFASVNYLSSSKLGSFRLLDSNFTDINATFTSESGYDYTQPIADQAVPEPMTMTLVATGLACVFARRRVWPGRG